MRLDTIHLRLEPARASALIAGIAAAAAAFTLLCMNATAPTVQIRGKLPAGSPRRAYDILVRVPSRVSQSTGAGAQARPTDLAELAGGITLAQYNAIRRLPGVEVAAPMTMVGYVPLTVVIPVAVPAHAITGEPDLYTVTAVQRSDNGLTTVTQRDAGSLYLTAAQIMPADCSSAEGAASAASAPRLATCWSTITGPQPQTWGGLQPSTVSVPLAWTFLLPLVAVDPAAEARLLHLDRAVVQGSYLPASRTRNGPVPMIMASSIDDDARDDISLDRLPSSAASSYADSLSAGEVSVLLAAASGQTVGTSTVTAGQAYADLLQYLRGSAAARVPAYWTPSPANYIVGPGGALTPVPVPSTAGFRALTLHVARSQTGSGGNGAGLAPGAALQAVGVFDPARIVNSATTPSPYRGEQLSAADARSRRLLGGGTLGPDGNPAGYPSPGATLVMPLQDIGAFTAASAYSRTDAAAPIGSIRVRVAGATGDDAVSRERARMVAQEIVRATGLHVEVTLAASATRRTIDLPAAPDGLPALQLSEVWYRTDTRTTLSSAVDPRTVAISAAVLLLGAAFVVNSSMAAVRGRRRELDTLRALGWRKRHVAWHIVREFALISVIAGLLAVLAAASLAAAIGRNPVSVSPLLGALAAAVMTLGAASWHVRRATARPVGVAEGLASLRRRRAPLDLIGHGRRNKWRSPGNAALSALVVGSACAALGLELTVRWVFGGVVVGSLLGKMYSWQDDPVDLAAVAAVLAMAVIALTDIRLRGASEQATELRTLRAIGWSAASVARLAASEIALVGVAGGVIASVIDAGCVLAVAHEAPPGLLAALGAVLASGVALSAVTAGLSTVAARAAGVT